MEEQQSLPLPLACDDSYLFFSNDRQETETSTNSLLTDEKYAEELQFQEAIMASIITSKYPSPQNSNEHTTTKSEVPMLDVGESSQALCEICADRKDSDQMFAVRNCTHSFCTECITRHVQVKLQKCPSGNQEGARLFACPGFDCRGVLEIDTCREIVPKNVVSMWEDSICESLIDDSEKFYCPYKDCSGMMVNDNIDGKVIIEESECPYCHRLFCARCRVPWHSGIGCEEFSKLEEDEKERGDLMVHELAKQNKWQRCPRCKFFVEKTDGCLHISCRCGYEFCYACGATWSSTHGGCQ